MLVLNLASPLVLVLQYRRPSATNLVLLLVAFTLGPFCLDITILRTFHPTWCCDLMTLILFSILTTVSPNHRFRSRKNGSKDFR